MKHNQRFKINIRYIKIFQNVAEIYIEAINVDNYDDLRWWTNLMLGLVCYHLTEWD